MTYRVRVRNTSEDPRSAWATFAKAARQGARLSQSELARRLAVERTTVWRWETGRQKPEDADTVAQFASVTGIDLDEALAAAGLKPGVSPLAEPTRERDEEVDWILAQKVDEDTKTTMLERLFQLRERDKQGRLEELAFLAEQARRRREGA